MRKRIRIYSPYLPYPITEGAYRVIFDQALSLLELGHEVELVTWKNTPEEFKLRSQLWRQNFKAPQFLHLQPSRILNFNPSGERIPKQMNR